MKINFIFFVFLSLMIVTSCSNLSKNTIESGNLPIRNGVHAANVWKEDLNLKRYSWYHELNLQVELLVGTISAQSGFNFWLSKEELEAFNSCKDARFVLAYSLDTKLIPYSSIYEQIEKNGFNRFEVLEFKRNLIQHPDSVMNSFKLYHVFGICRKSNELAEIKISFPGYSELLLK